MEESLNVFPFRKLRNDKYLTLEIMMYVDYKAAYKCMFSANKETKSFLFKNADTIQNAFINEGLIYYDISCDYKGYDQLEKLYF